MQPKFKQGDNVRVKDPNIYNGAFRDSHVAEIVRRAGYYSMIKANGKEYFVPNCCLEPISPTTGFLTELQTLLRKYEAIICGSPDRNMFILVGENDKIELSDCYLSQSNIFDYEKSN